MKAPTILSGFREESPQFHGHSLVISKGGTARKVGQFWFGSVAVGESFLLSAGWAPYVLRGFGFANFAINAQANRWQGGRYIGIAH